MKKFYILLLVSLFTCLYSLAATWGTTTSLNPYAYDLTSTWDEGTQVLTISFTLNAPAVTNTTYNDNLGIQIHAVDENGQRYCIHEVPTNDCKTAGVKSYVIDFSDGKGNTDVLIPKNETLTWEVTVHGNNKTLLQPQQLLITKDGAQTGKIKNWRLATSIAVNNDPNSSDFGSIYVAGNAYYDGTKLFRGLTKYDPQFVNQGWYGIYNGNTNFPRRVRVSKDGRIFASSYSSSSPTVWEVSPDLNKWTTRISEGSTNLGMDVRGTGNDLKILLYSHKSSYICNEYTWSGYAFSTGVPVSVMHNSTSFAVSGVTNHQANIRYDNLYNGYWFIGSRGNPTEPQLAHVVESGTTKDEVWTGYDHFGGAGALSYDNMLVKGHDNAHTTNNPSKLIFYTVSKDANGKVQLTPAYDGAKSVHSTCLGRFVNDFAIDCAYNLYVVSTQNTNVSDNDKSIESTTGQLMAFALPYSGSTITPAPSSQKFSLSCDETMSYDVTLTADESKGTASVTEGIKLNDGYKACNLVTVTAKSKGGYRFVDWTIGNKIVSTDSIYSFTLTRNVSLQANFAPNVFNVEWYGLFQNHEDITDPSLDTERNARLWRLFQVEYNKHAGASQKDFGESKGSSGSNRLMYYVLKFVNTNFSSYDDKNKNELRALIEDFLDNEADKSNFYWLGQYIESVVKQEINDQDYVNIWGFYLQSFINRTKNSHNQDFSGNSSAPGTTLIGNYKVVDFSEKSKPIYWRPYWTNIACKLPKTYKYGDGLPKDWNCYELPVGWSIADNNGSTTYNPCNTWCKWNNQEANPGKMLAWYYDNPANPTWPENPTIVRNVYQDGALFATWVDKLVSEELTNQNNSDAIWLLNYYGENTHDIKIERRMQGGMYNTLCLPFSVNQSQLTKALPGATVMQFTGVDEDLYDESGDPVAVLNFTQVTSMEAGVPYLVKPAADITSAITFSGITTGYNGENPIVIETAPEQTPITLGDGGSVTFQGTILSTKVYPGQFILVANDRLAQVTQPGDMAGMRGHFIINDPGLQTLAEQGRVYLSMKKPVTTSIPVAPEAEQQRKPEVRKIMRNGQIYIIRDGVTYTITGARVK